MIRILGTTSLKLKYTDEDLEKIISSYISKYDIGEIFTYISLCKYICYKALCDDMYHKKANTEYDNIDMSEEDYHTVTALLWSFIWDRKIIIEFRHNPYAVTYNDDTIFRILNK